MLKETTIYYTQYFARATAEGTGRAGTVTSDGDSPLELKLALPKAFGGKGYQATTPAEVAAALREALASGRPALIDCVIDPSDGTESGNIAHLNPKGITAKH